MATTRIIFGAIGICIVGITLGFLYSNTIVIVSSGLFLMLAMVYVRYRASIPTLYFTQESAFRAVSRIYMDAANSGGHLMASHVRPKVSSPGDDVALKYLTNIDDSVTLVYERLIFVEDKLLENRWIENTLTMLSRNVHPTVYFVKQSYVLQNILWSVVQRANVLLLNHGTHYHSFIGLDTLGGDGTGSKNFAIEFFGKRTYMILREYFQSVTGSVYVDVAKSIQQFPRDRKDLVLRPTQHSVITRIIELALSQDHIRHVGTFGRTALMLNGLVSPTLTDHESDIDIMIVVANGCLTDMKQSIAQTLGEERDVELVWGSDENYFYHYRAAGKTTVDIEIHEEGTDFYVKHALLGCSVFAHYYTLHNKPGITLTNLLDTPIGYQLRNERYDLLVNDRKGLDEFEGRLKENYALIDPKRVLSICIRNVAWAETGLRPLTTSHAMNFLESDWRFRFPSITYRDVDKFLTRQHDASDPIHTNGLSLARLFVKDALAAYNDDFLKR